MTDLKLKVLSNSCDLWNFHKVYSPDAERLKVAVPSHGSHRCWPELPGQMVSSRPVERISEIAIEMEISQITCCQITIDQIIAHTHTLMRF